MYITITSVSVFLYFATIVFMCPVFSCPAQYFYSSNTLNLMPPEPLDLMAPSDLNAADGSYRWAQACVNLLPALSNLTAGFVDQNGDPVDRFTNATWGYRPQHLNCSRQHSNATFGKEAARVKISILEEINISEALHNQITCLEPSDLSRTEIFGFIIREHIQSLLIIFTSKINTLQELIAYRILL